MKGIPGEKEAGNIRYVPRGLDPVPEEVEAENMQRFGRTLNRVPGEVEAENIHGLAEVFESCSEESGTKKGNGLLPHENPAWSF